MVWCYALVAIYMLVAAHDVHVLMKIWLVGVPHQMIPPFSMFKDGRELKNCPR